MIENVEQTVNETKNNLKYDIFLDILLEDQLSIFIYFSILKLLNRTWIKGTNEIALE